MDPPARGWQPTIRSYEPAHRDAIRDLCCRAAAPGRPLESFFPDARLFADLMTRYYLEREPGSTRVAVGDDGALSGYLLGCRDSRRQRRWQGFWYVPTALLVFLARGGFARAATWRLVRANLGSVLRRSERSPARLLDRYPAHLHLAVESGHRGRGVGSALLGVFLSGLRSERVPGVHAVVREENRRARRFFEGAGFVTLTRTRALRHPPDGSAAWKITYGRKL